MLNRAGEVYYKDPKTWEIKVWRSHYASPRPIEVLNPSNEDMTRVHAKWLYNHLTVLSWARYFNYNRASLMYVTDNGPSSWAPVCKGLLPLLGYVTALGPHLLSKSGDVYITQKINKYKGMLLAIVNREVASDMRGGDEVLPSKHPHVEDSSEDEDDVVEVLPSKRPRVEDSSEDESRVSSGTDHSESVSSEDVTDFQICQFCNKKMEDKPAPSRDTISFHKDCFIAHLLRLCNRQPEYD